MRNDRNVFHSYMECSEFEKKKVLNGYKQLKAYKDYYLYGKYINIDGREVLIYKECFSRFDIDGVPKRERVRSPFWKGVGKFDNF